MGMVGVLVVIVEGEFWEARAGSDGGEGMGD